MSDPGTPETFAKIVERERRENGRLTIGAAAERWFSYMHVKGPGDRPLASRTAALSALRRVRSPFDACHVPLGLEFVRQVAGFAGTGRTAASDRNPWREDRIMAIPPILAHVGESTGLKKRYRSFGAYLGQPKDADDPTRKLSDAAFRRLLAATDQTLVDEFRRVLDRLGDPVPVGRLAETVAWWGSPRTVRDLTIDFYDTFGADGSEQTEGEANVR